jgi:hypothetical protein
MTCARTPSYLRASLLGLMCSVPEDTQIRLIVHETSLDALGDRANAMRPVARVLTAAEHAEKMKLGKRERVSHATKIALEDAPGEVLLLQDDVQFATGWFAKFETHLATLSEAERAKSVVALYSHLPSSARGMVRWHPSTYWGTVALFYGSAARLAMIDALAKPSGARLVGDDRVLQQLLRRRADLHLYAIYPSIVQHVGVDSAIGSKFYRSPTFEG